jgi:serine/threonine protein phosphatase 1
MATIAVGDVHGQLPQLADVLGQLAPTLGNGDTVVFLGDYIDRGPDTRGCVDAILQFRNEVSADVVGLLGNHEDWMVRTLGDHSHHAWLLGMDAFETIASYSAEAAHELRAAAKHAGLSLYTDTVTLPYERFFDCLPAAHRQFFETLRVYHRTDDCLCSHAGLDPAIADPASQSRRAWIWGEGMFPLAYRGDETLVYGHRNNAVIDAHGWPQPAVHGRAIGIDTIAHGVLTAIRLPGGHVVQSARGARRA